MARFLKKATNATIVVGPFVDDADGKTAETGLTLTQALTRLSKNGADPAQKHEAASATHKENGYYAVTLDDTDTGTVGRLRVMVLGTGALPVWEDFVVLDTAVFDWLMGAVAPAVVGDIMKISSGTGANQLSLASGVVAASVAAAAGVDAAAVKVVTDKLATMIEAVP